MSEQFTTIPIELLVYSGRNPRHEMRGLEELAENIKKYGVRQPVIVRPKEEKFEVVCGERRVRASKMAGLKEVPAILRALTDRQADIERLIENIQRDDLTNVEKGDAVIAYASDYDITYKEIANDVGVPYSTLKKWLYVSHSLSEEVRRFLYGNLIMDTHARVLAKYDHPTQDKLLQVIRKRELTPTQTENLSKLYDENPNGDLDELALQAKGLKLVTKLVPKEELPKRPHPSKGKPRKKKTKRKISETRKDTEKRKKAKKEKKPKPPPPLLPDEKEKLEKYMERARAKKARDLKKERKRRGEFMQAKAELMEKNMSEIDLEHSIVIGDARGILKLFPESCVDLVITSPPYFDLKEYPENPLGITTQTIEGYLQDLRDVFSECFRVLKDGRFFCIVVGQFTSEEVSYFIPSYIVQLLERIGFKYRREHVWVKPLGIQGIWNRGTTSFLKNPFPRNAMINIHHEHILVFQKGDKPEVFYGKNPLTEKEVKEYCWSVWELQVSEEKDHPAPFPDVIPKRLMKMYSYEGEVVLDPFLGSGTCIKMAKTLKRRSIGIEVNSQYLPLIYLNVGDARIIRHDKGEIIDLSSLKAPRMTLEG